MGADVHTGLKAVRYIREDGRLLFALYASGYDAKDGKEHEYNFLAAHGTYTDCMQWVFLACKSSLGGMLKKATPTSLIKEAHEAMSCPFVSSEPSTVVFSIDNERHVKPGNKDIVLELLKKHSVFLSNQMARAGQVELDVFSDKELLNSLEKTSYHRTYIYPNGFLSGPSGFAGSFSRGEEIALDEGVKGLMEIEFPDVTPYRTPDGVKFWNAETQSVDWKYDIESHFFKQLEKLDSFTLNGVLSAWRSYQRKISALPVMRAFIEPYHESLLSEEAKEHFKNGLELQTRADYDRLVGEGRLEEYEAISGGMGSNIYLVGCGLAKVTFEDYEPAIHDPEWMTGESLSYKKGDCIQTQEPVVFGDGQKSCFFKKASYQGKAHVWLDLMTGELCQVNMKNCRSVKKLGEKEALYLADKAKKDAA